MRSRRLFLLEWSNGQTEGQVNRLKLLKRQMYGRANFDLLTCTLPSSTMSEHEICGKTILPGQL